MLQKTYSRRVAVRALYMARSRICAGMFTAPGETTHN